MLDNYGIRTDLALEATERFTEENVEVRGVEIHEDYNEEKDIRTTVVKITTENGARTMGRPQGSYITIEAPGLSVHDEDYHREISLEIARHLQNVINLERELSILVVGLGNSAITADSLGPHVVENLHITRHMIREYGLQSLGKEKMHRISGIIPGVMAQTGMETSEIIQGIVAETKPDIVIAIDALAARSTRRLNRTIQITDTGINPGSGVGNHRVGLTEENLQVKVIGIGVPTVVDAATIVHDSMAHLLEALEEAEQKEFLEAMDYAQASPSLSQAQRLKKLSQEGGCTLDAMCEVMNEIKKDELDHVTIKNEVLRKYFPKSYTPKQMQDTIIRLLEKWQRSKQRDMER